MSTRKKKPRPSASAAPRQPRNELAPQLAELLSRLLFPPEYDKRPLLLAIAGANGAGKSALHLALKEIAGPALPIFFNVDDLTIQLGKLFPELPKLDDAGWAITNALREHAARNGIAFTTELLLSDPDGQRIAALAQARAGRHKFRTAVLYVTVESADLAVIRVAERSRAGGHGFDPNFIREHFLKSHEALPYALQVADVACVLDNSEPSRDAKSMRPLLFTEKGRVTWEAAALPDHIALVRDQLAAP